MRFANVAVFLIEYGRYPYFIDNHTQIKQLWNVSMYQDDHTPHITINPCITILFVMIICVQNVIINHYQCPYLHLDKKFVSTFTNCQCSKNSHNHNIA